MKKIKIVFLIAILLLPWRLRAEDHILTLEEAVQEVLSSNPDIQAAHYKVSAAKARIPQAKSLEDPLIGVMFDDVPIDTANVKRAEEIDYRIEQKIPFPGKRYVRGKAARYDANSVEETSRGQIRDVILDLKKTYYDIYRIDRFLEVNHENQGLFRQWFSSAKTAYAANKADANPVLKAQVELSKLENEELLLKQEHVTHLSHLKALLNQPHHEEIRLPEKIIWPHLRAGLEEIKTKASESRPELTALRAMEKRDKTTLTKAKQSLIPDFSLGFQYGQRPGVQDTWAGTAMMNLPIFFWGKNRGEIQEAKASLKATQAEHQSMEIHTQHEIEQSYSAVRAAEDILQSYEKGILPQAKTTLESAQVGYASNRIDFLTLVDAAKTYKDLKTSYYENQANLGMSFAELERLVGTNLEDL